MGRKRTGSSAAEATPKAKQKAKGDEKEKGKEKPDEAMDGGDEGGAGKKSSGSNGGGGKTKGKGKGSQELQLLAQGVAYSVQQVREHESILYDVVLLPSDSEAVKAIKSSTKQWDQEVKEKGRNHGLGPPRLRAWDGLIAALAASDVGSRNKEKLKELEEKLKTATAMERELSIRARKAKVCYDKEFTKIAVSVQHLASSSRELLLSSLEQVGAVRKSGRAPPTNLERSIQKMIDDWQS